MPTLPSVPTASPPPTGLTANASGMVERGINTITDLIPGVDQLPPVIRKFFLGGLDLVLLLLLFLVLRKVIRASVRKWTNDVADREEKAGDLGRAARLRTLTGLTTGIVVYTVAIIFGFAALSIVGADSAGLLGTASIAGIAIGFGAQKVAKDVITGFIILFEDQYAVGEYVTINAVSGTVEELAMRTTQIRDDEGKLYILSNGDIAQVCNQSRGPVAGSFDINIAFGADVEKATEALNDALTKASKDLSLAQPAHVAGISAADAAKTTLKVTFHTGPTVRPGSVVLNLRNIARTALLDADIKLGAA